MKYSFAVALSTLVLGIAAAPAANGAANSNGNGIAHAERGYFDFLHHAARAEKPSKTRSAKSPKKTKPSKTRNPGSIITSAPGAPGNATDSYGIRASNGTAPAPGGGLPASSGTSVLKAAQTVAAGESFDGGMVAFDRGVSCTGQAEGGDSDAVFILEKGAKLSNVIIGPNQIEGVHCNGGCALDNVWWSAVCEDAFTIKLQDAGETTTITGGGAFGAEDKVLQHNGGGTLSVSGFTVETFGKLYRSCGNCKTSAERHVIFDSINASSGKLLAGINSNFGDTATFKNVVAKGVKEICTEFKGTTPGNEPSEVSSGPSAACIYSTSDVTSS
ncbi:pectate lyase [Colletotrichum tabaci]|uniref:Pectate lyase n=1 Tax=Colletotrichum tabaci TaxID=1209068 RepID=A0AAV9SVI3_9PEZI